MNCKYLIQWIEKEWVSFREDGYYEKQSEVKVCNFTDEELEKFCINKEEIKITFICIIEK